MSNITTCLWFDKQAEEAANFYVKVFGEGGRAAKLGRISRYGKSGAQATGQQEGLAMTAEFELEGSGFLGLNGGPMFKFSPATSFVISCATQEEVDYFWTKLSDGGQEGQCGWINFDKFGVSWQIVPKALAELMSTPDAAKADRVMKAMLGMKKIIIADLQKAADEA